MSKLARFEVMVGACVIDRVYFDASMTALEVRKSLIERDRKPPSISVYKLHDKCYAYTDCARATHPEELT